jgi:hypothetical protein
MRSDTPSGLPIGRAFEIPPGFIHDDLRQAVSIIESVHGVDELPRIPLYGTSFPTVVGDTRVRRGRFTFAPDGSAVSIAVELDQDHRILTTLHEIGHFLDLVGLGTRGRFESALRRGALAEWRTAIAETSAVRTLVERTFDDDPRIAAEARGQLAWQELWARSYAQYVINRGGQSGLPSGIDAFRSTTLSPVYLPLHWLDDDFTGVGESIDSVFRRLGWRKEP